MDHFQQYRTLFPIAERLAYLNHAELAPLGTHVAQAVRAHAQQMQREPFERLLPELSAINRQLKTRLAQLIGAARSDEIVAMPNTATGINTAAKSLPLKPGDTVLLLDGDYPANIYPWMNLAPQGVRTRLLPQQHGGLDLHTLEAAIDRSTRVVALSSAMFATGFRNELTAVGALCKQRGIYFVVDAIQTLGAFPLNVQECQIDLLACGGQKWLQGMQGSGFLYCRRELLDELQLGAYVGTYSVVDPLNYLDYNFTLRNNAERFSIGSPNWLGIIALHTSVGLLLEIGVATIRERILDLTDILIGDLRERGYRIRSNLAPQHRSGIVMVEVPDPEGAYTRLMAEGVVAAVRDGVLRLSPHFYNSEEDVLRVGEVLGSRSA